MARTARRSSSSVSTTESISIGIVAIVVLYAIKSSPSSSIFDSSQGKNDRNTIIETAAPLNDAQSWQHLSSAKKGPKIPAFAIPPQTLQSTPWSTFRTDESKQWDNRQSVLREVMKSQKPILIKGSPAQKWPAMMWTWDYLANHIRFIRGVRNQSLPIFTLRTADDEESIGGHEHQIMKIIDKMPFMDFLRLGEDQEQYLYYTTPLESWSPAGLEHEVKWRDFEVKDKGLGHIKQKTEEKQALAADNSNNSSSSSLSSSSSVPVLWLAHGGVTAQCHYDKSHNFFVQIIGRKRFTLWLPSQHSRLYQHPAIHVSQRQSQVDFEYPSLESFPYFTKAKSVQVELEPGDVLYIPPYWFHMVESLDLSLSLSVLSPSQQEAWLAKAYWTMLPFKLLNNTFEKVVGSQTYLVHLLSRAEGVGSPWKIARWLYKSRFSHLYPQDGLFMLSSRFSCYSDQAEEVEDVRGRQDKKGIIEVASHVASLINHPSISKAVRQTWLGDYIEEVARWAMEGPESVPLFITECLNFESLPTVIEEVEGPPIMKIEPSQGEQE